MGMVQVSSPLEPWPENEHLTREYACYVDKQVHAAYMAGYYHFGDMLPRLNGIYPSIALESLHRLAEVGQIRLDVLAAIDSEILERPTPLVEMHHEIVFPTPHPLDYDWRFAEASNEYLLLKAHQYKRDNSDSIFLLGTPSVMRSAIERGRATNLTLLDANNDLLKSFRKHSPFAQVFHRDIGADSLPLHAAKIIITDPPWYEETMQRFLWAASRMSILGGHILIVLPSIGTRQGVKQERDRLVTRAEQFGLSLRELESGTISYTSPFFERNALRAQGILNVPSHWRRADLAVFQHVTATSTSLRPPRATVERSLWQKYPIGNMQVQVRRSTNSIREYHDPALSSIIDASTTSDLADILPSTSRRDKRRALATIWTTGNRIYSSKGTELLSIILRAFQLSQDPGRAVAQFLRRELTFQESQSVTSVLTHLRTIACKEQEEHSLFFQ